MYNLEYHPRSPTYDPHLEQIKQQKDQLQRQIYDNNQELRLLNGKMFKNDYEHSLMNKLQIKQKDLLNKQTQLSQSTKNNEYIMKEMNHYKQNQNHLKHNLGQQYKHLAQQKKKRSEQEKRRNIFQQREMQDYHRKILEDEQRRRKQQMEENKRMVQQELALRESTRIREKMQKERQKQEYNQKVKIRNQIQTQKDSVYKQYYNQFRNNQEKLQGIYKNTTYLTDREKQEHRRELERKQLQQYKMRLAFDQEEKAKKYHADKNDLKSYLQFQMEENNQKKAIEKEMQRSYNKEVAKYQMSSRDFQQIQRKKKHEDQHRYDQELKMQTRTKPYSHQQLPESPHKLSHNPITYPIDFKADIRNPYVRKEYEHQKLKHLGDGNLKLSGLAQLGGNTLNHHHQ